MHPRVSFIVPCYKLGHLLGECVQSILAQSFEDFEVLIMDDCSPDNTGEVARSFSDPRVQYIRNEPNLGHLRNYNKGIGLARGKYIWLISADDTLRKPYALERYVSFIEAHPRMGFVFCPAMGLRDGNETGIARASFCGDQQRVFKGLDFLVQRLLARGGGVAAPSVMARKECYEKASWFPLDLPHQADAYLWGMWTLQYDVGYLPEPLVHYRLHRESMMAEYIRRDPSIIFTDELTVYWRLKSELQKRNLKKETAFAERRIAAKYVSVLLPEYYGENSFPSNITLEQCNQSINQHAANAKEAARIRARAMSGLADHHVWNNDFTEARQLYRQSLREYPWMPAAWIKFALLRFGANGNLLRSVLGKFRRSLLRKS